MVQSKAATVVQYLKELPADRRRELEAVRQVILANLDDDYEEGMQYGMIGYYVPHRVHPAGYHCDPKQPFPFAGLAAQAKHLSVYLMCVYGGTAETERFVAAWKKTGKKLDMGKSCIRFQKADDLALDVIADAVRRHPAKVYIERCLAAIETSRAERKSAKSSGGKSASPAKAKSPGKKSVPARRKGKSAS